MKIIIAASVLCCLGSAAFADGGQRILDPLTLPPAQRREALTARLGDRDFTGAPADAGCRWSRFSTPTPQGVRWLLQEDCSDTGFRTH